MDPTEVAALFDRNRLRTARELRGLTQVQLAREVGGVQSASLSQFETGHARPSANALRRLAVALRVPVEFFAVPVRPDADQGTGGFFRSLRSTPPRERHQARAYVELVRQLIVELEKVVALPELNLLPEEPGPDEVSREDVDVLANKIRDHWDLPPGPIDNMIRTLERNGILVTRIRTGYDRVDAFSVPFNDRPIIVLGADKGRRDRSRFDAAHELGHLVMHVPDQAGTKQIETQAHHFAAAFLMPKDQIRHELPSRADWPHLMALKAKWQVSIAALLMRARALEVMNESAYVQAMKVMSMRGWRKSEPGDLGPPEQPVLITRAMEVAADAGVTFDDLVLRAGLPADDIRSILGNLKDERPQVQL